MPESSSDEPEPRFAGSAPAGYQPPVTEPVAAALPTSPPPTAPAAYPLPFPAQIQQAPPFEPEIGYSGAFAPPEPDLRQLYAQSQLAPLLAPLLAAVGGIIAAVGSLLNWATLRLVSKTVNDALAPQDSEHIAYNGLRLLEGRVSLVVGIVAVILSILMLLERPLPAAMASAGAVGVLAALFAAIAHPVDLSVLSQVFGSADAVTVRIPNGPGVWLALVGSALILGAGLVAHLWRDRPDLPAPGGEQPDE